MRKENVWKRSWKLVLAGSLFLQTGFSGTGQTVVKGETPAVEESFTVVYKRDFETGGLQGCAGANWVLESEANENHFVAVEPGGVEGLIDPQRNGTFRLGAEAWVYGLALQNVNIPYISGKEYEWSYDYVFFQNGTPSPIAMRQMWMSMNECKLLEYNGVSPLAQSLLYSFLNKKAPNTAPNSTTITREESALPTGWNHMKVGGITFRIANADGITPVEDGVSGAIKSLTHTTRLCEKIAQLVTEHKAYYGRSIGGGDDYKFVIAKEDLYGDELGLKQNGGIYTEEELCKEWNLSMDCSPLKSEKRKAAFTETLKNTNLKIGFDNIQFKVKSNLYTCPVEIQGAEAVIQVETNPVIGERTELTRNGQVRINDYFGAKVTVKTKEGTSDTIQSVRYGNQEISFANNKEVNFEILPSEVTSGKLFVQIGHVEENYPQITGLCISGESMPGKALQCDYEYQSTLPDQSLFQWQKLSEGTWTDIPNENQKTFTPKKEDEGSSIRVAVTEKNEQITGKTLFSPEVYIGQFKFYVSLQGDDKNNGTLEKPFQTIERARDAVRELKASNSGIRNVAVYFREGTYPISSSVQFTKEDSGNPGSPVLYQAFPGEKVVFSGGTTISADGISKVTEEDTDIYGNKILDRLHTQEAKDNVVKIDLSQYAGEFPKLSEGASYQPKSSWPRNTAPVEVYINGSRLTPARWPNNEKDRAMFQPTKTDVTDYKTKPVTIYYPDEDGVTESWNPQAIKDDLMIGGYLSYMWYMNTYKVGEMNTTDKYIKTYGGTYTAPSKEFSYYLYNILDAIDAPGEGFIDRTRKIAYFYPDSSIDQNPEIVVAGFEQPLLKVVDANNLSFIGIDFMYGRNEGINISGDSSHITIDDCNVAHFAKNGINCNGTNITIQNCNVFNTGDIGIRMSGGDRKTLTPSNNKIINNVIHDQGNELRNSYVQAINITNCVGAVIANNEIYNNNHSAIGLGNSNDIIIEYNDIHDVVQTAGDMGAIYTGRDITNLGYVIRYNKFSNIGNNYGLGNQYSIYFDDGCSGGDIYGNIFYQGTLTAEEGGLDSSSYAVTANGGQFMNVHDNIFIDVPSCVNFGSWYHGDYTETQQYRYVGYHHEIQVNKEASGGSIISNPSEPSQWKKITDSGFHTTIWEEHYKGTIWEPLFDIFSTTVHAQLEECLKNNDAAAGIEIFDRIAPSRQNFFRNNLAVNTTVVYKPSKNATIGTNYVNADITTEKGTPLFVDFTNQDFRLTKDGLAEVQKTIPEFQNIDTSKIGPQVTVDGGKPQVSSVTLTVTSDAGTMKARADYLFEGNDYPEARTRYSWYAAGEGQDFELIYGLHDREIYVPQILGGRALKCIVTPSNSHWLIGSAVESNSVPILADTADTNKEELVKAIEKARTELQGMRIGDQNGEYPQEAVESLRQVVAKAEELNQANVYQYQVNQMVQELNAKLQDVLLQMIVVPEIIDLKDMLSDTENWVLYTGKNYSFTDGKLVLEPGAGVGYKGKKFRNALFSFKMRLEKTGDNPVIGNSVNFRAIDYSRPIYSQGNGGYLWWTKNNISEAQFFAPNQLFTFDTTLQLDKDYNIQVGVYDDIGKTVKWVLYIDGKLAYERCFEHSGNLFGEEGYFLISGAKQDVRTIISAPYTELEYERNKLKAAIEEGEKIKADPDIVQSGNDWDTFVGALESAKSVFADNNALIADVSNAIAALDAAKNKLTSINKVRGHSLTLDGSIGVNFYATLSEEIRDSKDAYVLLTCNGKQTKIPVSEAVAKGTATVTKDGIGYACYKFTKPVYAHQMTTVITAQLFANAGDTPVELGSYTVKDYLDAASTSDDARLRTLINKMADYGAYAQRYKGYDTNNLPKEPESVSGVTIPDTYGSSLDVKVKDKIQYYGSSLVLDSETELRIYFNTDDAIETDKLSATAPEKMDVVKKQNNLYYVRIPNIKAQDLDKPYTVAVSYDGVVQFTVTECAASYMARAVNKTNKEDLQNLLKAMYRYHLAAKEYLNQN